MAPENELKDITRRVGAICVLMVLLGLLPAPALHCGDRALWVGGVSLLDGGAFGLALALVTRTQRPFWIYAFLGLALLALWPVCVAWPPADSSEVHLWRGAPDVFSNYFDVLRVVFFVVGTVWPFARFGQHSADAPDSRPKTENRS